VANAELAERVNGPGAAAVLATSIGWFVLGVLALAGDAAPRFAQLLNIWKPTGPLSGVTSGAIVIWLLVWLLLARLWRRRDVGMAAVGMASAALMVGGLLLTFPPFMDFVQGR
jgi:hypothetical protein